MEVTIKPLAEESKVELTITLPTEDFIPYIEKAARSLSKDYPLKGFRPGKVPLKVAQEHYGTERLLQQAVDKAIPHFFVEAVLDGKVDAINRPNIVVEELGINVPLRFKATVEVLPSVTLPTIANIQVEPRIVTVEDAEIEREIAYLAKARSTPKEVERAAQQGDTVIVDFVVSIDGQPIENGTSQQHPIQLGNGHFLPAFDEGLMGIKAHEERTFPLNFPADYPQAAVAGKKAEVHAKASSVQEQVALEINDEFAKKLGKFDNLDHFKKELRSGIQAEKEHKEKERFQAELAEELAKASTFTPIPEILVEQEISHRLEEFAHMLSYQQKTIEDYLQQQQKTITEVRAEMRETAVNNVKIGLAVRAFAVTYDIEATDEEITEELNRYLKRYESIEEAHKQVDMDKLRDEIGSSIRNRKSLAKLQEVAGK